MRARRHPQRRKRLVSTATVSIVITSLLAAALVYDGEATADVDLNDGGVWVTSSEEARLGRLNHQVQLLDGSLATRSGSIDVQQDGEDVFLLDEGTGVLQQVDPATVATTTTVPLPEDPEVGLAGGTLALLNGSSGQLYLTAADAPGVLADEEVEPAANLGANATIAVGPDGTTYGLSRTEATVTELAPGFNREEDEPVVHDLDISADNLAEAEVELTAVGQEPVAMVRVSTGDVSILRPDAESQDLSGLADLSEARLQAPSEASDDVVVAASDASLSVPLGGGEVDVARIDEPGRPAQPVVVAGCRHAAWSGAEPSYQTQCGDEEPTTSVLDKRTGDPELTFRVNRDVVVLNDMLDGTVWLVQDAMEVVENWDDVTPPDDPEEKEDESTQELQENLPPDREEENRDPVAEDDDLGLRAGTTILLEVLANDSDPDGDLLTVADFTEPPEELGTIRPVMGGRALQIDVAEDATGSASITYTASDGRGGSDEATARLTVVGEEENRPPQQERDITMTLTSGATGSVNVLDDVTDPDGDELVVVDAETNSDDEVRYTPDGTLTFVDSGVEPGTKHVTVTVSDSRDTAEVDVEVDVRPDSTLPPVPVFDFVSAVAGQEVTVEPLVNDTDPAGDPLRLADVEGDGGASITPDYDAGTFRFEAEEAGTHYLTYIVVNDAGASATGLVRVDVQEPADDKPTAVQDTALLPAGGETLVDVLANDDDPSGRVLAVRGIDVPDDSGLSVAILDHQLLKITSAKELQEPVRLTYEVSNGEQSAEGEVVVMPVPAASLSQPPVAKPDVANVRAGDYVTIPVTTNDSHPGGADFELSDELVEEPEAGHLFVSGDTLRFRAPEQPQTVTGVYEIVDESGQTASAQVTIYVQADDGERNSAPQPLPVDSRAFAGERVRIPISMFGIDPDGDSVQLLGTDEAPTKGRVVEVGPTYIDYEAYSRASGTDEFTYAVRDRLGAYATASVEVGIIAPPDVNRPPEAVDDAIHVRPDRKVEVDVLANDTDPDGDPLYLDDPAFDEVEELEAEVVEDGQLQVRTPTSSTDATLPYHVTDQRGGRATGILSVEVSEDAPLQAPIAVDDAVAPVSILDKETVTIAVLDNDSDPDGSREELEVSLVDEPDNARVVDDEVEVDVKPTRQVLTYSITDPDGLTSYAFIDVPGMEDSGPVLRTDVDDIVVATGDTREIDLSDYVVSLTGDDIRLTDAAEVQASNSDGSPPVEGPTTLSFTSAPSYAGPASITFEVTDGDSAEDPEGRTSVLTLDIMVESTENQPPVFDGTAIEVAPGEEPVEVNLRQLSDDPDPGDFNQLEYELHDVPDGIEADLDGPNLTVSAPPGTETGMSGEVSLTVSDNKAEPVAGEVEVTVTTSNRRLPAVNDIDLGEVQQGETRTVAVLDGAYNPFPDEPLDVVEASVTEGEARASAEGGEVSLTVADDYVGRIGLRYRVMDATGDEQRAVEGQVTGSVVGAPERPHPPRVEDVQDGAVVLSWSAPGDNGSTITGYLVEGDGVTQECATTTCTVEGLQNGSEYTFTVRAINEVGESETSGPSGPARPDVKPEKPQAPELDFGDGALDVSWQTPQSRGSAVSSYDLQISPSPGSGGQVSASGNNHTWTGLANGESYRVRVRAHNDAPDPSQWSEWSAPEVPAGSPDRPARPQLQRVDSPVEAQVTASWEEPADNGDGIDGYDVTIYRNGSQYRQLQVPGDQTSVTEDAPAGEDYTVRVAARNKAGTSATSSESPSVRSFTEPSQVSSVGASATGDNGEVELSFSAPAANGEAIQRYEYRAGSGNWRTVPDNRVISGLTNGQSYTMQVRACNSYCGDASPSSSAVVPYGPLGNPSISGQRSGSEGKNAKFEWSSPGGNGRDIDRVELRINDGSWQTVDASGSRTEQGDWDTRYEAEIRVTRSDGAQTTDTASVTTAEEPQEESVTMRAMDDAQHEETCSTSSCAYLGISYENLPNGSYTIEFDADREDESPWRTYTQTFSGSGEWPSDSFRGYDGEEVSVTVRGNGLTLTDSITWPK